MESLIENMENVSLKPTLQCDKCECSYTSVGYLKTHMKKKHGEELEIKCQRCSKTFTDRYNLERHAENCNNINKCKMCEFECEDLEELTKHKSWHTTCHICNKDFIFVSKLKRHMTTDKK